MEADGRGLPDTAGTVIRSSHQTIETLARTAVRAFDQVAWELGEDGYRSRWGRAFPRSELEVLRSAWRQVASRRAAAEGG